MPYIVLDENSSGATSLLSVNGSLNTLFRWALPQLGWAVEFGPTGNDSVFRAATGNRRRLHVRHNSSVSSDAGLAYVRGAHTATSATAVGTPFPTAAQVPNTFSNWRVGVEGDPSTPCRFVIAGNETFFHYFCGSPSYGWEWHYFGDVPSDYATTYETIIAVRNSNTPYSSNCFGATGNPYPYPDGVNYWARGINAITVSTKGCRDLQGSPVGRITGCPPMRGGYQNRVLRQRIALHDIGAATDTANVLSIPRRGWLPNVWSPLHYGLGGLSDGDTFTDSAYNPAAQFRVFDSPSYGTLILETTDTWSKP